MLLISDHQIRQLNISPTTAVEWVREAFLLKNECQLPPKISLHTTGRDFFNTMPCLLPEKYHTYGCKIISRIEGNTPTVNSKISIFDTRTGQQTALLDGNWITATRTGAVASLAIKTLQRSDAKIYSFIGLGVAGHSTLQCLLPLLPPKSTIRLKRYKDHAEKTIATFSRQYPKIIFEIADTMDALVKDADVVVSCITQTDNILVEDTNLFKPGVLVVPVHTRGFQNCDTVFDKVFADDKGHVSNFRYFSEFKQFGELGDVLTGKIQGRTSDEERILSYNIGISIHDIFYSYNVLTYINATTSKKSTKTL